MGKTSGTRGFMGPWVARNRGNFWRQTPLLIPVHHFLPGHLTSQSLQLLICTMG